MFWLAVIGIMVAGTMAAGSMPLKGWIAGWIGMIVAFVGLDSIHAVPRFTFDSFALFDGISYVAVLIGLFGLAEILRTLPSRDMPTIPSKVGRVFPPFGLLAKYAPSATRSGILGTFIGAIPGAGANVASFLAYDIGRRRAKPEEREKWGKGSYQALVCAETANNANIGGSMLPTLALGIPGNAAAAALLAALTLKNVVVGPTIELDHPGLIYFIYSALIVANILMYIAAFALIGPCVKLFSLPRGILMPLILPVCIIGAYAVKLSMFDVWIMFAAGVVGWLFTVFKFPVAPVVLGVILVLGLGFVAGVVDLEPGVGVVDQDAPHARGGVEAAVEAHPRRQRHRAPHAGDVRPAHPRLLERQVDQGPFQRTTVVAGERGEIRSRQHRTDGPFRAPARQSVGERVVSGKGPADVLSAPVPAGSGEHELARGARSAFVRLNRNLEHLHPGAVDANG